LEIPVPRPAGLDIEFDPVITNVADAPFKSASLEVMKHIPGTTGAYSVIAVKESASVSDRLRLSDLSPGTYRIGVRTHPKRPNERTPGTEINPGAFHDFKELTLEAAQS